MVAPINLNSNAVGGRHRGGRGNDPIVGRVIKIRRGPLKGYRGRVKEVTGSLVRVELDSQMKIVTGKTYLFLDNWFYICFFISSKFWCFAVKRDEISDIAGTIGTPGRLENL